MTQAGLTQPLREKILSDPDLILDDPALMQVLIGADDVIGAGKVVDLRSVAMRRLESRLDRLEDTHRSVIAAAYENLAGTYQIHRAVLSLLAPLEFRGFLAVLHEEVAEILEVQSIRLVLETHQSEADPALRHMGKVLCLAEPGFSAEYMRDGRHASQDPILLRKTPEAGTPVHDTRPDSQSEAIRSEAVLALDLGAGRLPAMLVLGSNDPNRFKVSQGTDLLGFFGAVFERMMQRFLG
ncbi:DUF484 family protein [Thioclava sp. GXIMD2076]|uniref:DUF484 family protein n=1 Tax=Thioclava kandeliae TaxID=3070818 RepID=A0ABV1SFU5_9RHOB